MRAACPGAPIRSLIVVGIFLSTLSLRAQSQSSVCFKSLSDFSIPTGINPYSIATGDLDGDGKRDIVVANRGDGTLKVLLGTSGRRFGDGPSIDIGEQPLVVLAIDLDGDGDLDLAALRSTSISTALNDSHGTFSEPQTFEISSAIKMAGGDFNGDGKADLISSGDDGLFVHISNGDGTFTTSIVDAIGTSTVRVGDFNTDGKKDIAYASDTNVKIFVGNGDGNFTLSDSRTFPDPVSDFGCGDVNDDGKVDILVVANDTYLVAGDGAGNFNAPNAFPYDLTSAPVIKDVDVDGENDIIVASESGSGVLIYRGANGGSYDAPETHIVSSTEVLVEDMDADGKNDLVVISPLNIIGGVSVLFGQGNSFESMQYQFAPGAIVGSFTGDLNSDGKLDLVIAEHSSKIFVYLNTGGGYSNADAYEISDPSYTITGIASGEFNSDSHTDLVVTLTSGKINVWLNDGDGTFTDGGQFTSGPVIGAITAADINGDDHLDVAVASRDDNHIAILLGDGTGSFGAASYVTAGDLPTSIASADLNNDDKIDLVVGNEGSDEVSMLIGNGDGTFIGPLDIVVGSDVDNHVSLADLNNDGLPELITLGFHQVSGDDRGYISIRRNLGSGFAARVQYDCAGGPKGIGFGDFNGDGKMDVAVAGYGVQAMGVLMGNGDGTLGDPVYFATGTSVLAIAGDVTGDGLIDIVASSGAENALIVLENNTARAEAAGPTTFCTGSVTLNANTNAGFYEWTGPVSSSNSAVVATVRGTYTLTTSNYSGRCVSTSSVIVDGPPAKPEVNAHDATCEDPTASISIVMQDDGDSYSFDNGQTFQGSSGITGLAEGTYHMIIKSANGCLSEITEALIGPPPPTPPVAVVTTTPPTCDIPTGSININVINVTDTYSIDEGETFSDDHLISDLTPGLYFVVVKNLQGCKSDVKEVIIEDGPMIPSSLSVVTVDPTCAVRTGSISVIVQNENDMYSFDNGQTFQVSNTKEGLTPGLYDVIIKNEEGCNSEPTETIIYPAPVVPSAPVAQVADPTCSEPTGSIAIVAQSPGEQYSFNNGDTFAAAANKEDVATGTYSLLIKSVDGCISPVSHITVKEQPVTPGKPSVMATTQANGDVLLQSSATAADYIWLKDGTSITDATTSTYTATMSGNYALLIVSAEGCSSKPSDPLAVLVVGDIVDFGSLTLRLYPNPATTALYYSVQDVNVTATIFNSSGKEMDIAAIRSGDQLIFDITELSMGVYLLKVDENGTVKTIPWVKR